MAKIYMKEFFKKQAGVIEDVERIVNTKTLGNVKFDDGTSLDVDTFTASMVLKIYNALSSSSKMKCKEMINKNRTNFQKLINMGWKNTSNKKQAEDVMYVTRKVKDKMDFWKKHDNKVYTVLKHWFDAVVSRGSFKGLPDVDFHLGLNADEYKVLKQYVVTIRRAL